MFGKKIRLLSLFGFEVSIDLSWIILAFLITWTLTEWVFPHYYKGLTPPVYLFMGIAGALGLFASIIFHELLHSLVARRFGLPMKGITLFIFGGVAEMAEEPPSPRAELMMAIAGPLASICLGLVCMGILFWGKAKGWPVTFCRHSHWMAAVCFVQSFGGGRTTFDGPPIPPPRSARHSVSCLCFWARSLSSWGIL